MPQPGASQELLLNICCKMKEPTKPSSMYSSSCLETLGIFCYDCVLCLFSLTELIFLCWLLPLCSEPPTFSPPPLFLWASIDCATLFRTFRLMFWIQWVGIAYLYVILYIYIYMYVCMYVYIYVCILIYISVPVQLSPLITIHIFGVKNITTCLYLHLFHL